MAGNIGPLDRESPPFGGIQFNDQSIAHYMDVPDFLKGPVDERCMEHAQDGRMREMLGDFMLGVCSFPEETDEQIVRTAFVCPGPSLLKKCRLQLLQADASGNVIETLKYTG